MITQPPPARAARADRAVRHRTVGAAVDDPGMTADAAPRHHAIDYVELTVTDLDRAKRFYADAFGWSFTDYGPDYAGFRDARSGPEESGGLRRDDVVRTGGGPLVLLFSAHLDATVAAVTRAGGQVVAGPYEFPGGRRFHFTDPDGTELGVWSEA
jgi:predicted enzyme related to lactoylglutathione lyase